MAEVTIEKSAIDFRHNRLPANFKILVVGSNHKAAMEQYYLRYLKELGVKIDIFPAQGIFYAYYNASFLNKLSFKLGLSRIYKIINARLLAQIKNDKPDLLFVFKGMEIFPATLARIKKMGIKLVNYNPDSPFVFSGPGSGNKNVRQAISLFDLYLTYDRGIQWQLQERKVKSVVIPFGFDISEEEVRICAAEPEILRVCFLGNPDKERADFLNRLAETQVPIDVYGVGWDRFQLHDRIKAHGPVYELEYWKVLRKYRVQLNLMRPHNPHSHNMRSLEIPGVGGIGLFPETPDHRAFFQEGKELFFYKDVNDCAIEAHRLLHLDKDTADRVRLAARKRSMQEGYSYKHRAEQFLDSLTMIL